MLDKVAEEDFDEEKNEIKKTNTRRIPQLKSLILTIKRQQSYDLVVLAEGSPSEGIRETERDLNVLERANLIKGKMKFTEQDAYRRYVLTKKGDNLAASLLKEQR
jgi:hypothetical protein